MEDLSLILFKFTLLNYDNDKLLYGFMIDNPFVLHDMALIPVTHTKQAKFGPFPFSCLNISTNLL